MKTFSTYFADRTIRFRRFTRTRYAVFSSLHKQVTIGHLTVPASDQSCEKTGYCPYERTSDFCSDVDDDFPDEADALLQQQECILLNQQLDNAAACCSELFISRPFKRLEHDVSTSVPTVFLLFGKQIEGS